MLEVVRVLYCKLSWGRLVLSDYLMENLYLHSRVKEAKIVLGTKSERITEKLKYHNH